MVTFSPSSLFKKQFLELDRETQESVIITVRRLLDWMGAMSDHNVRVKAMELWVPVKGETGAVFRYLDLENTLAASKFFVRAGDPKLGDTQS